MKLTAIIALLACLSLALQADAFKVGKMLRVFKAVVEGVSALADLAVGRFTAEQMGFQEDEDFKAQLVGITAFCQMRTPEGRHQANTMCAGFGHRYYPKAAGEWSCASSKGQSDDEFSCLFQPAYHFVPQGEQAREVVFRRDGWPAVTRSQNRIGCRVRNPFLDEEESEMIPVAEDEILPAFPDRDHFFSRELVADLKKYILAYEGTIGDSDTETDSVGPMSVSAIVAALEIAGIRYPLGKRMCQLCKGTCGRIVPSGSVDLCKYTVCVKTLGGYKGSSATPSCSDVKRP